MMAPDKPKDLPPPKYHGQRHKINHTLGNLDTDA